MWGTIGKGVGAATLGGLTAYFTRNASVPVRIGCAVGATVLGGAIMSVRFTDEKVAAGQPVTKKEPAKQPAGAPAGGAGGSQS